MAAEQGDAQAQFNLGVAYYNGEGVPKDKNRAIRWLRLAADQNFAEAQYSLATLLLEVDPVINKHEGIRLLQQAAEQHHVGASEDLRKHLGGRGTIAPQTQIPVSPSQPKPSAAQLSLAKNYRLAGQKHYNGQGTKQNFEKAYAYFRKAAELGDSEAQRYLALLLFHGKGCAQNRIEAGQWLRLAASTGDMEAKRLLTTFAHLFK